MNTPRTLLIGSVALVGVLTLATSASMAAPRSVVFNGNTYYVVNGNDPKMDTGDEVCASIGKVFDSYKSITTNGICKLLHPTARELVSVNGSKAGFYCNGAPQQGIACAAFKNTCEVCPACNLNEAAAGNMSIAQHFAEMYVWCKDAVKKAGLYGPLPLKGPDLSKDPNNCGRPGNVCPVGAICTNGACARQMTSSAPQPASGYTCTFSQRPLKKVTCGAYKAADTWCVLVMQSITAKAVSCSDTGNVVCSLPCNAPGIQNFKQCAYSGVKGGFCPAPTPPPKPALKHVGQTCQHGGECTTSYCVGVPDYYKGMQYFCSCSQWKYDTTCGK